MHVCITPSEEYIGTRGYAPQYFRRGGLDHSIITQLQYLFDSSICNPVYRKNYWSIEKFVGFAPPPFPPYIFYLPIPQYKT